MAFVAIDQASGKLLGAVRLHADANHDVAEYAILVRSDLKGRGLGWKLMQLVIEYAKADGIKQIQGEVLRENTVMLRMCEELGFNVAPAPDDQALSIVSYRLV
jgi:acetyltransferase